MLAITAALLLSSLPLDSYTPPEHVENSTTLGLTPERWDTIESVGFVLVFSAGVLVAVKL